MASSKNNLPFNDGADFKDEMQSVDYHMAEIRRLEKIAESNAGPDPLQNWVNAINYIKLHFPVMNSVVKSKLVSLIRFTIETFHTHDRYKNDWRLAPILINVAEMGHSNRQVATLSSFLDNGVCDKVSDIYKFLAEKFDKMGDSKKASEILMRGIANDAEPKHVLEEMLRSIQIKSNNNVEDMHGAVTIRKNKKIHNAEPVKQSVGDGIPQPPPVVEQVVAKSVTVPAPVSIQGPAGEYLDVDMDEIRKMLAAKQEAKEGASQFKKNRRMQNKMNFFTISIKYEPLPDARVVDRVALNEERWWRNRVDELSKLASSQHLRQQLTLWKKETEILKQNNHQQQMKQSKLEGTLEELTDKLTQVTTESNVKDAKFNREKSDLIQENKMYQNHIKELKLSLEQSKLEVEQAKAEVEEMKRQMEEFQTKAIEHQFEDTLASDTYLNDVSTLEMSICTTPKRRSSLFTGNKEKVSPKKHCLEKESSRDRDPITTTPTPVETSCIGNNVKDEPIFGFTVNAAPDKANNALSGLDKGFKESEVKLTPASDPAPVFERLMTPPPPATFGLSKRRRSVGFSLYQNQSVHNSTSNSSLFREVPFEPDVSVMQPFIPDPGYYGMNRNN